MCPRSSPEQPDTLRITRAQQNWLDGLKDGDGITSPLSRMTIVGGKPDLLPIVVSFSHVGGLKRFLTTLATSYALKEESTGELMLMLSLGLELGALRSLLDSYHEDGNSEEIGFEILMPVGASGSMSPNMSLKTLTSGISGAVCMECDKPFAPDSAYVHMVSPVDDYGWLEHKACFMRKWKRL